MESPLSSQPEWRITTTGRPASHFEISCPFRKPSFIDLQTVLRRARPADRETPSTERLVTWTFHEERVNRTDHPQSRIVPFRENSLATVAVLETYRSAPASSIPTRLAMLPHLAVPDNHP